MIDSRVVAELSEWHFEGAPVSLTGFAELIALASLTGAPAGLLDRAVAEYARAVEVSS